MKNYLAIIAAAFLAFALFGCSSNQSSDSNDASANQPSESATASSNNNPAGEYKIAESADEAAANADLKSFTLPDEISFDGEDLSATEFESIGSVAQAVYEGEDLILQIRKAPADSGIYVAGDVSSNSTSWTTSVGSTSITCLGETEDQASRIEWTSGNNAFMVQCISLSGEDVSFTEDDMAYFVDSVK